VTKFLTQKLVLVMFTLMRIVIVEKLKIVAMAIILLMSAERSVSRVVAVEIMSLNLNV